MQDRDAVAAFAALAQPSRLQIFRALVGAGREGLTPGALVERLGVPAATLSFHLKELARADLVTQQRSGRHLIYRFSVSRMNDLLAYLTAHCCGGDACLDPQVATCPC